MNVDDLKPFQGSLVGFSCKPVKEKGYITFKTTFRIRENSRQIKVINLVIDAPLSYNMIIGWFGFNQLRVTISTLYLCMKCMLLDG